MTLPSWSRLWKIWNSKTNHHVAKPRRHDPTRWGTCLRVEILEDRTVPSALYQIDGHEQTLEGSPYVLQLTSDPAVTIWTIDWGDGPVEIVPGNPSTVSHTYVDEGSFAIVATATDGLGNHVASVNANIADHELEVTVRNVAPTLVVDGSGPPVIGEPYTIFLNSSDPGADTISQWTIDWGDGTLEVIPGNPTFVEHTYREFALFIDIVAAATDEDGTYLAFPSQPDLLRLVVRAEGDSGNPIDPQFLSHGPALFGGVTALGPDGNWYASNQGPILRFDGQTGEFLNVFVENGMTSTFGVRAMTFGPDGDLFVFLLGNTGGSIERIDGQTGGHLGTVVSDTLAGVWQVGGGASLNGGMAFGPDGYLYLTSSGSKKVLQFNADTGEFLGSISILATRPRTPAAWCSAPTAYFS